MTAPAGTIPHGTLTGCKHFRCHCEPCTQAGRDYQNHRARLKAYGTWQSLTNADRARDHIELLKDAGVNVKRIAQLSGVSRAVIDRLLYDIKGYPRRTRIRVDTETRILAVCVDRADQALTDATGTIRRLQALQAVGWPLARLAEEVGLNRRWASDVMHGHQVELRTARRVAAVYDRLANLDPTDHGILEWVACRARNKAANAGWRPPAAWIDDDLDAPAEEAETDLDEVMVERLLAGHTVEFTSRADRISAARTLHQDHGMSPIDIAVLLGTTDRTIWRWKKTNWQAAA